MGFGLWNKDYDIMSFVRSSSPLNTSKNLVTLWKNSVRLPSPLVRRNHLVFLTSPLITLENLVSLSSPLIVLKNIVNLSSPLLRYCVKSDIIFNQTTIRFMGNFSKLKCRT
jgi:hypothetical protein